VAQEDAPDAKKFDTLTRAMALAERDEERQLVLSGLANVATVDALTLAASCMDSPALREEACLAAVTIAEKLGHSHDARVTAVMKRVTRVTANKELAARSHAIVRQAKK
jgi:hypothetical protein